MAIAAGLNKSYQLMQRALKCPRSVPLLCRNALNRVSELGLQAQPTLGGAHGLASSRENDGDQDTCMKSSNQVLETSLGSTENTISVTFVDKNGDEKSIKVPSGMSMLEAAHQNEVELEGACEGSLACSTCHVIVMDEKFYNKLPEPTDEENDMLDLAFGLTETSRLGCQVLANPELDGIRLAMPSATRNFAVDGYVPKPH